MELLPFGPPCDYFPVLPCTRYQTRNTVWSSIQRIQTVAFGSLQSFCSVDETSSSILDALVDLLWRQLPFLIFAPIQHVNVSQDCSLGDPTCHAQQKGSSKECVHRWWFSSDMEWLTTRPNSSKMVSKRWPPTTTAARWYQIELLKMAAEDGCPFSAAEDGCSFKAALQKAPPLWFFLFLHITVWRFSFCLLCSSCCVALPHVASPPCRHFWSKQVWSCRGYEPKLGPLPPSLRTSLGKVGFEKERPADLPPVPGGARRCHVSWKEKIKLFVMRFRAKGFRDQRGVKLQEGAQWPNQMHAVPQPVGKMQRDCLRQKGPRWECGVNDSSI